MAQEVTITISPGWNWISYPRADTMELTTAMGTFTPAEGDMIKSRYGFPNIMKTNGLEISNSFIQDWATITDRIALSLLH